MRISVEGTPEEGPELGPEGSASAGSGSSKRSSEFSDHLSGDCGAAQESVLKKRRFESLDKFDSKEPCAETPSGQTRTVP